MPIPALRGTVYGCPAIGRPATMVINTGPGAIMNTVKQKIKKRLLQKALFYLQDDYYLQAVQFAFYKLHQSFDVVGR